MITTGCAAFHCSMNNWIKKSSLSLVRVHIKSQRERQPAPSSTTVIWTPGYPKHLTEILRKRSTSFTYTSGDRAAVIITNNL